MAGKLNTPFVDGKIKGMSGGGSTGKAPKTPKKKVGK